jgi:hypothetical protein
MRTVEQYRWDIFIAHPNADFTIADELYGYLEPDAIVFLASRSLELGDDWGPETAQAQRESLITTVLVSSKTPDAYYQQEEVIAAIDLSRDENRSHRVIPIYLDGTMDAAPYGLRSKHGIIISGEISLRSVAVRLLDLLGRLPQELRPSKENRSRTIDFRKLELNAKQTEIETALAKAEANLLNTFYPEALACLELVPDESSYGPRKQLIKIIARIGGRSFNNLANLERENVERELIAVSKRTMASSLPFVLLAILELDYYRNHGRRGSSGITPASLQECLTTHPLTDNELSLLRTISISERALKALKVSTLSPG